MSAVHHPPAPSAPLTILRDSIRVARHREIVVRIGSLGVLDMGRDGWERAPHIDGVSPIGAVLLAIQPVTGVQPEQAACMALGCDLAALEGINDGLEHAPPAGAWGASVAKDNYRSGYEDGTQLRVDLLAPTGALRVAR